MTLLLPKINEATIPTQTEFECLNGYTLYLDKGIWCRDKDQNEIHKVKWNHFQITRIFLNPDRPELRHFHFELNNAKYIKRFYTFKEMQHEVALYCDAKTVRDLNQILMVYIEQGNIPKIDITYLIGFTENGWQLPNKYAFSQETGEMYNFVSEIHKALENKYDDPNLKDRIPEYLRQIHAKMTIQYKDLILLWGLFTPFASVYQQQIKLMPYLGLISGEGGIGKSESLDWILGKKIWGYNPTVKHDRSTTSLSYISMLHAGLSFYRFHDELDKCDPQILRFLKTLMTDPKQHRTRMGTGEGGQKTSSDLIMSAPFCFASNTLPDEFVNDEAFRARGVILEITVKPPNWKTEYDALTNILQNIPDGDIGAYIYQITENWTSKNIIDLITTAKQDPNLPKDSRQYQVYLYFKVSQLFCQKYLGLELSLDGLKEQIQNTLTWVNDVVVSMVETQLKVSKEYHTYQGNPIQRVHWIDTYMIYKEGRDYTGYIYTDACLHELNMHLKTRFSQSKLERLLTNAGYKFPIPLKNGNNVNGRIIKGLFFTL